jgi:ATP-dependent Clp protease ATP-binding subunit ClpA
MDDAGRGVRDLVEHALHAGSGEDGLRAVAALKTAVDELELEQARRALAGGASFGAVARALGITRQSAHRRYRHLLEEQPEQPVSEPRRRGRVLVTAEARQAVDCAREEARGLGVASVGSEHLLLGIVRCANGPTGEALRMLGVTLDAARGCALPTEAEDGVAIKLGEPEPGRMGISDYARTVLEQSLREALERGDGYIGTDHLLLAALRNPAGGAARTLEALGVPPEVVRAQLDTAGAV